MGEIAVVHMDLWSKGGGESVCMHTLEALQADHDVTLVTLTDPDFDELNAYFGTDVCDVTVRRAGWLAPWLHRRYGVEYYVLQNALLGRYARRHADEFDLLVSTINELGLETDSVQYVHFPFDWSVRLDNRDEVFHPSLDGDSLYERAYTAVAGVDSADVRASTLLANSAWTADVVEEAYGTRPAVVYPPVNADEFEPRPWRDREQGFVTVGRVERSKRVAELVRVVDGVRDRGHDVHLHVIGPTADDEYRAELDDLAADRPHVTLEGELPREELVDLVCTHRYGIHGKRFEHFGMAVAELAAGGAVPFVPASGGQCAVVRGREEQCYESVEDAVEKIDRVLDDPALQRDLRMGPGEIQRRFGRDRFKAEMRSAVADALGREPPRRRVPAGVPGAVCVKPSEETDVEPTD
jgi:glycosyltransferase involved in cell wall biosynthesis